MLRIETPVRLSCVRTVLALCLAAAGLGADRPGEPLVRVERARYLMGTICRGTAYHLDPDHAARSLGRAFDAISDLEGVLSNWRPEAELSKLNGAAAAGPVPVSAELATFLRAALALARETQGAFDPTVGGLLEAWDMRGKGHVPARQDLAEALRSTGFRRIRLDRENGTVAFLSPGLRLDSGALGKGYALDRAGELLRAEGIDSALLDFGGQLLAIGAPPGKEAWEVALADPDDRRRPSRAVRLRDGSLATSGQSERGFEAGGRRYGHVLDPSSGAPVDRHGSVTVLAPTASEADAFSTALLVMGKRKGGEWLKRRPQVRAIWLEERTGEGGEGALEIRKTDSGSRGGFGAHPDKTPMRPRGQEK